MSVMDRAIVSEQEDRPAWLAARAVGVTATMIKKLMQGGPGAVASLVRENLEGDFPNLESVPRVAWGRAREEFIATWIEAQWGIKPTSTLFYAEAEVRYMATPDGIGEGFDGDCLNSEIKTGMHDLDPEDPAGYFWESGYYYQIQWAMLVTGALQSLFVWEQHDNDWSGWPARGPQILHAEPRYRWIQRDDAVISDMIQKAEEYLRALDAARGGTEEAPDAVLVMMSAELLAARKAEAEAKRRKDLVWGRLLGHLAEQPEQSKSVGLAQVTWTPAKTTEGTAPDPEAAAAAHPLVFAAVRRADALWAHIVSKYTRPTTTTTAGRLTVTPTKGKK